MESDINLRRSLDSDGNGVTTKVGDFTQTGYISLTGEYPQNQIDIPRYDLSKVVSLNTDIANFNFILSIKDGDGEPKLFCNKNVMIDLIAKYGKKEPIPVNYLINQRKIVLINIAPLNDLTEVMRGEELSINLYSNEDNGQIEVTRHLYTYSNYQVDEGGQLVAEPSYDLNELIKYVSWVVQKPNPDYDDRLIVANELGDWDSYSTEPPEEDEPPTDTTYVPSNTVYPPIGRAGIKDGENVVNNLITWVWNAELNKWQTESERLGSENIGSGNQGGGEPDS